MSCDNTISAKIIFIGLFYLCFKITLNLTMKGLKIKIQTFLMFPIFESPFKFTLDRIFVANDKSCFSNS